MSENNTLEQVDDSTEVERRQALSHRLKEIADRIASTPVDADETVAKLAIVANTCPTDPAELAMCDSCQ